MNAGCAAAWRGVGAGRAVRVGLGLAFPLKISKTSISNVPKVFRGSLSVSSAANIAKIGLVRLLGTGSLARRVIVWGGSCLLGLAASEIAKIGLVRLLGAGLSTRCTASAARRRTCSRSWASTRARSSALVCLAATACALVLRALGLAGLLVSRHGDIALWFGRVSLIPFIIDLNLGHCYLILFVS